MNSLSHALPNRALPSRAVKLISEYSKPLTRPDWRTFIRITKETFIKDKLKLCTNTRLYKLVHMNMYDYLYCMTRDELIHLIMNQVYKTNYYYERDDLNSSNKNKLILTLIEQENDINQKHHDYIMKKCKITRDNKIKRIKKLRHSKKLIHDTF
jgi:hypothetical protein